MYTLRRKNELFKNTAFYKILNFIFLLYIHILRPTPYYLYIYIYMTVKYFSLKVKIIIFSNLVTHILFWNELNKFLTQIKM